MQKNALERVTVIFTLFDRDGDGRLEAEDFEIMGADVVRAAPLSSEAARNTMRGAFERYWTTLAAELDADRDGTISFDEFTACVLAPERFDDTVREFAEALAALGDPDGDGLIERPVFLALMTAIGFEHDAINALFDAFGPSESDQITVPTWVAGIKDYYSPTKAGIPGDHLVTSGT
ncbi:EF-hand domain-containing protein [Lentzea sp. HUAS12]|uniref:EF-hand domain-containing protein n=1 Tax=Lentzea sp. HUAS12 TaxID=2951806 RepID=UPI00209E4366|nr:EF-hand domain-containing protein [Lentzea sp. HUAS12]USX54373.1 EF-hand domain-containing protein [Lentzea sp. HUAS12]